MSHSRSADLSVDLIELNRLEMMATKVAFAPNETIFTEGEIDQCVYLLSKGTARLYKQLSDGRRQIIGFAIAGDFLALPRIASRYSANAVDNVLVHRLSKIAFLRFLESSPQFIGAIGDFVHREVWWSQRQIILLGRGSPEQKLMAWLFAWRERSKQDVGSSTDVRLPMMRKDIAEYLNLTIATVSRTLNRFKRERLIAITPTGIRIMDLDAAFALARSIDPTIGRQICSLSAISAQVLTRLTALLVPIAGRLAASCPEESLLALVA